MSTDRQMSRMLENCWTYISMYHYSPINMTRSRFLLKEGVKKISSVFILFMSFCTGLENNAISIVGPTIFQQPLHMWLGCKIVRRNNFFFMFVLQSRQKDSNSCKSFTKPGSQSATYAFKFCVAPGQRQT